MSLPSENRVAASSERAANVRFLGPLLLTAFLGAATVPALLSWIRHSTSREVGALAAELDEQLRGGAEDRRAVLPSPVVGERDAAALVRLPERVGLRFRSELVFSAAQIELFAEKSHREVEFERALKPPEALTATVTPEGVELAWGPPADLAAVRERLRSQPLLRLGFRVYRWREGDEPKLLTTFEGGKTAFQDRDLPLWQERFFYCVATVLEGTIGDLPTLIESKRSAVITADISERFTLRVLAGEADEVRCALEATLDGRLHQRVFAVAAGAPIVPPAADDLPAELAARLATGLTLTASRWVEGSRVEVRERPEFLPDGRRKLDPASGLPTFRSESATVPTRALEVTCRDRSGATRTFTSAASN